MLHSVNCKVNVTKYDTLLMLHSVNCKVNVTKHEKASSALSSTTIWALLLTILLTHFEGNK